MRIKNSIIFSTLIFLLSTQTSWAGRAAIETVAAEPYASAFVIDADSGDVLFSKNPDLAVYPASTLKLMVLLVILDRIEEGTLQLNEIVPVTVEAAKMGGSQVYLDPKEQFPLEELLYALMIQSANDAAVALASHVAGSTEAFVALMNEKARELGMNNTTFHSVHGLPPGKGQEVDVTTAKDFALLCRVLSKRPQVFQYTGTKVRDFRRGEFVMRTHNHLLDDLPGCDGFKTGYFTKAGFSIAATAKQKGVRLIAIVMGSKDRKVRDAQAIQLIKNGFSQVPPRPETAITIAKPVVQAPPSPEASSEESPVSTVQPEEKTDSTGGSSWIKFFMGVGVGILLFAAFDFFRMKRSSTGHRRRNKLS